MRDLGEVLELLHFGDSFTATPGQTLQAFNRGSTELIVVASYLLPDSALLTTNL